MSKLLPYLQFFSGVDGVLLAIALLAFFGLWIYALVKALTHPEFDPVSRFMWVFVIVMLTFIGALLYLLMVRDPSPVRYHRRYRGPEDEPQA